MTSHDTTYFISNPHYFEHQDNPNKHHNTFKFLRLNTNECRRNYSEDEVRERLEASDPCPQECCVGEGDLVTTDFLGIKE